MANTDLPADNGPAGGARDELDARECCERLRTLATQGPFYGGGNQEEREQLMLCLAMQGGLDDEFVAETWYQIITTDRMLGSARRAVEILVTDSGDQAEASAILRRVGQRQFPLPDNSLKHKELENSIALHERIAPIAGLASAEQIDRHVLEALSLIDERGIRKVPGALTMLDRFVTVDASDELKLAAITLIARNRDTPAGPIDLMGRLLAERANSLAVRERAMDALTSFRVGSRNKRISEQHAEKLQNIVVSELEYLKAKFESGLVVEPQLARFVAKAFSAGCDWYVEDMNSTGGKESRSKCEWVKEHWQTFFELDFSVEARVIALNALDSQFRLPAQEIAPTDDLAPILYQYLLPDVEDRLRSAARMVAMSRFSVPASQIRRKQDTIPGFDEQVLREYMEKVYRFGQS